jgi:uncharacterized membrane protein YraQ (UPF0718 family)
MKKYFQEIRPYIWLILFCIFVAIPFIVAFQPAKDIATNFKTSLIEMITFIPFLFIIVGLFDVWVPKERIQQHIGQGSGIKGIAIVVLLAMLQAGPLYGAFPVAYMLWKKGASIRNIFIYLGAFTSLKIPMLGIEIAYLGVKFTLVRTLVSLPLFIAIGYLMEWYLKDKNFKVNTIE